MRPEIAYAPLDFGYLCALARYTGSGEPDESSLLWGLTVLVNGRRYGAVVLYLSQVGIFAGGLTVVKGRFSVSVAAAVLALALDVAKKDFNADSVFVETEINNLHLRRLCATLNLREVCTEGERILLEA